MHQPSLQALLSMKECLQRPVHSFIKAVLEPLKILRQQAKIDNHDVIILVDSLNDAEYHKPDYGETITSFISKVMPHTPNWLKWVVTVKTTHVELLQDLPLTQMVLWQEETGAISKTKPNTNNNNLVTPTSPALNNHNTDILEYITYRAHVSNELKANICMGCNTPDPSLRRKFYHHLVSQSKGNFLYCKLVLDLIESGYLVLKTANFKILPVNLHEVLLLNFNLKFPR